MAALPYIQLYVADYLADTMHLSTEEHGAYLLLIFNYWQTGKPLVESRMPSIAKLSPDRWSEMRDIIAEFFDIRDGKWMHDRIETDLKAVKSKSIKASRAGKKSAEKRALQATENKNNSNERSTDVLKTLQQKGNQAEAEAEAEAEAYTDKSITSEQPQSAKSKKPPCPLKKIIDLWNEMMTTLPQCSYPTEARPKSTMARQIRKLWQTELSSINHWRNYFDYLQQSDFLMGRTNGSPEHANWQPTLEWVTKPTKYTKIYDGDYHS